jgi:uncharacterized protein (TIGR00661 family)
VSSGKQKHILIAVLDWGLGHATRSIPVIHCLLANHCKVSIAGNGASLTLLKQEFPNLYLHELPSYKVTYPSNGFFFWSLFFQSPRIFKAIQKEKRQIETLVSENQIDAIISDNRYGCYSDKVPSVLINHQVNIQLPKSLLWTRAIVDYLNHRLIKKFDSCWVPDFPSGGFTAKLSETKKLNVRFIGMLSRFVPNDVVQENDLVLGLVSGPEPQREIFEKLLITEFKKLKQPCLIIRGLPHLIPNETRDGEVTLMTHAPASELQRIICKAGMIISRSGYSTIMDLHALGKKRVIFVPTPGQTEQEYLADELKKRKIAYTQTQDQFNLSEAIHRSKEYSGFDASVHHTNLLNDALQDMLHQL